MLLPRTNLSRFIYITILCISSLAQALPGAPPLPVSADVAVLTVGMLATLVLGAVRALSAKTKGPACEISNGTCVTVSCRDECAPSFSKPLLMH